MLGVAALRAKNFPRWVFMTWIAASLMIFAGIVTAQPGTASLLGLIEEIMQSAGFVRSGLWLVSSDVQTVGASQTVLKVKGNGETR